MQTFKHSNWDKNVIHVAWDLGNACNQNCSYCLPVHKSGKLSNGTWEIVESFADKLLVFCERANKFPIIHFGGSGETTAVSYFGNLLTKLNNRASCHIETNLSAPIEWWETYGFMINKVHGSVHYEYTTLKENYEKLQLVKRLSNQVSISVPMLPHLFQEQMADIAWFKETFDINIGMQALFINPTDPLHLLSEYTEDQRNILQHKDTQTEYVLVSDTQPNQSITHSQMHYSESDDLREFTDWQCWAGIDTLIIDSRGFVRRGWCAQHTMEQVHMSEWQFDIEPTTCRMRWCRHSHDLLARKIKEK